MDLVTSREPWTKEHIETEKLTFLQEREISKALNSLVTKEQNCIRCRVCGKEFSKSNQFLIYKFHILSVHLNYRPFQCSRCSFSCYSNKIFAAHSRIEHEGLIIVCEKKSVKQMVAVLQERLQSNSEIGEILPKEDTPTPENSSKMYICEFCGIQLDCPFKLLRHKKSNHEQAGTSIVKKSTTPSTNTVKNANLTKTGKSNVAKKSTGGRTGKNASLVPGGQSASDPPVRAEFANEQYYKCRKCDFITQKQEKKMIYHFKRHGFECLAECPHCASQFTDLKMVLKHMEMFHKGSSAKVKCLPIENYFIKITDTELNPLANQSGPTADSSKDLAENIAGASESTAETPVFKCVFCSLEEVNEAYMRYHLNIHLEYKPYKCSKCEADFCDEFQQKQHLILGHPSDKGSACTKYIKEFDDVIKDILVDCKPNKNVTMRMWDLESVLNNLNKHRPVPLVKVKQDPDIPSEILYSVKKEAEGSIESEDSVETRYSENDKTTATSSQKRLLSNVDTDEVSSRKKPRVEVDHQVENILCYYCSFTSNSITEVLNHTQQEHLKRTTIGLLWIDKLTGGTYDHEGHIFSSGFDINIVIEHPYLCSMCSFRSSSLHDVQSHEALYHPEERSNIMVVKNAKAVSRSRRDRQISYAPVPTRAKPKKKNTSIADQVKSNEPEVQDIDSDENTEENSRDSSNLVPGSDNLTHNRMETETTSTTAGQMKYVCPKCSEVSTSELQYRRHLSTHSGFKYFVADLSGSPTLKCSVCSYRAPNVSRFTKHMICHRGRV